MTILYCVTIQNKGCQFLKNPLDIIGRCPHLVSIPAVYLTLQLSVHLLQSDTFSELWIQEFHFTESSSHLLPVKETCVVNTGIVNTPVKVIFFSLHRAKNAKRLRRMDIWTWLFGFSLPSDFRAKNLFYHYPIITWRFLFKRFSVWNPSLQTNVILCLFYIHAYKPKWSIFYMVEIIFIFSKNSRAVSQCQRSYNYN